MFGMSPNLRTRILAAAYAAVASYVLLSLVLGPAGFLVCRALETRRIAMEESLDAIMELNGSLRANLEAVARDPDRAALDARSLGYLRPGEVELVLPMPTGTGGRDRGPGKLLAASEPRSFSDLELKGLAAALGLLCFLFLTWAEGPSLQRAKRVQTASRA